LKFRNTIKIYNKNSRPYGLSFGKWTSLWWKWLISIPKYRNPAIDRLNEYCAISQYHPKVWFLAGSFSGTVKGRYKIPYGKAILFPVINYECSFADEPFMRTEKELRSKCRSEINDIIDASAYLDGNRISLEECRVQSPAFKVNIPIDNCLNTKSGLTTMASDGYWLFIRTLEPGNHVLNSYGSCLSGRVRIGCNFHIIIESSF
jgi:hypothetical protein